MKYIIKPRASRNIFTFYTNVAKKYRHTYDKADLKRDVYNATFAIYDIERTLLRRKPTIERWQGYHMANRRTKQEQSQACLSYALQGGGRR